MKSRSTRPSSSLRIYRPYRGGRSAKSGSYLGRSLFGVVDDEVPVEQLDAPTERFENDSALGVPFDLAPRAVPFRSLCLQVDEEVGVGQVEFGDRYTVDSHD